MLIGYVSDEYYAALAGVKIEFLNTGASHIHCTAESAPSGVVDVDLPPGEYEVCLSKPGFGSKRVRVSIAANKRIHFRLLSDGLLGYAWPKWRRAGASVEFRVHAVRPYKLSLWRYGYHKQFVRNLGWYDNHGPRAAMQTVPDGFFVETGVNWDNGFGVHRQTMIAPALSGLYYFHAQDEAGRFFSFPLVVAPPQPNAAVAVLASTNTWNAYNSFGGRSNYIMAARMIEAPIVNSKSDLPRYRLKEYGEWKSESTFEPLSFDRPEPYNHIPRDVQVTDPIEGRQASHLAESEWRVLGWLEQQGHAYDLYADYQLHDGTLDLDAYRVLLLSVHPEYWSVEMYRRVKKWVHTQGGRLIYLGGNGINCAVEFNADGSVMRCLDQWPENFESRFHHQEESEANLLGVVFTDAGAMTSAPYEVLAPDHWIFAGTGLQRGELFGLKTLHERYGDGASGHETDKISASSPPGIIKLAQGTNPGDGGAHLVYYQTTGGGEVFSAGSITYPSALLCDPVISRITANVLERFLAKKT